MADLNAKLKWALDGPGPQHKVAGRSELEFSEGSNGQLHVRDKDTQTQIETLTSRVESLTQIIEGQKGSTKNVQVDNFPANQDVTITNQKDVQTVDVEDFPTDYPDANALTELQAMKADIAETKQQNAEILERLDGVFDTNVTGSNVEDGLPVLANKDFIEVDVSGDTLEAGKDEYIDVYANAGEIWTLKRFGYGTSRDRDAVGGQSIWLYHGDGSGSSQNIMRINGEASQYLQGTIPGWRSNVYSGEVNPSGEFEMIETLRGTTVLSDKLPVRIRFRNSSDKPATSRGFKLFFEVEKVHKNE